MNSHSQPMVSGLWVGDELPELAELCIRSYLSNGIQFQLFTYKDYPNIPQGAIVRDGRGIIAEEDVFRHDSGSFAPFSDWFRYTLLLREGGFWTDLDMICLSGDMPQAMPWFALQEPGLAAIGVIGFPQGHPVVENLAKLAEDPATIMPWDTPHEVECKKRFKANGSNGTNACERRRSARWGTTGPERFTKAVSYFGLMSAAAPPHSIYPLHYTVWRFAYDGTFNLESNVLQKSWAIHLWGELLRREPDALEHLNDNSIVAQAAKKYMPLFTKPSPLKKKVDILVGICSCLAPWAKARRDGVRETWLRHKEPEIESLFFVGRGDPINEAEKHDMVSLDANDSYNFLPEKVLAFFRYALDNYEFEWLFKCDDDTYLALDRLAALADKSYALIGDHSLRTRVCPSGGAGYFLRHDIVKQLVESSDIPPRGAEDVLIGKAAIKIGKTYLATDKLFLDRYSFPLPDNDMVSSHWCTPDHLKAIETFYHSQPVDECLVRHPYWVDSLLFYGDGFFRRKESGCIGRYVLHGDRIELKWLSWPPEFVEKRAEKIFEYVAG